MCNVDWATQLALEDLALLKSCPDALRGRSLRERSLYYTDITRSGIWGSGTIRSLDVNGPTDTVAASHVPNKEV